jgi:uncharacterized protein with NAD-binding domain and iron-sulfur cluster
LERASLAAARKVLVDGFLASRGAYVVDVPSAPLAELYGERLEQWLAAHGVRLRMQAAVDGVSREGATVRVRVGGQCIDFDFVVLAVPWHKLAAIVDPQVASSWPWLAPITEVPASPITAVHLWFDRQIMPHANAVLVGRLAQWVFHRAAAVESNDAQSNAAPSGGEHYYQVVISASRQLAARPREQLVVEVCRELAEIWPQARAARLLRSRVVTEQAAVFSAEVGLDRIRPPQQTPTPGILVAGDWTATGWPSTMESAVRSGYLAAEQIAAAIGSPRRFLVDDLPRGWLARRLVRERPPPAAS